MRRKLYLAAPLFSEAERSFNIQLEEQLSEWVDVFLPQRDGQLITDLIEHGVEPADAKRIIFETDVAAIQSSDTILAVLDGASIDEGVAAEVALGFAWGKECWALKTDFRSLSWFGDNPMVEGLVSLHFKSVEQLKKHVAMEAASSRSSASLASVSSVLWDRQ